MALWHSFPTPFSSRASECSVLERQATLVFVVGFGVRGEELKRCWADGGRRAAEEPAPCPGLCPQPVPEQQRWGQQAPRAPKARVRPRRAWTPLTQMSIYEQVKYLNQLRCRDIHLSRRNVGIPLGIGHQQAEEWFWHKTRRWQESLVGKEIHTSIWCAAVPPASSAEETTGMV